MLRHPHDFGGRHRPYDNIPTQHKPPEWGLIFTWIAVLIALAFFAYQCSGWIARPPVEVKRTLSPVEKAEHDRLRKYHGLLGFSVVLVKDKGLFFIRGGKEVRFR